MVAGSAVILEVTDVLRTLTKAKYRDLVLGAALLYAAAALMLYPQQSMQAGREGL